MSAQPTLALDVAVRPPHWRCVCGREVTWTEHRVSDGEVT